MPQVRIGFIGCGNIARRHVSFLEKMEAARLAGFCDVQKARAEELAARFSAPAYADYEEMLNKEELEAVYICTPPFARQNQEMLAAQKGLHVFLEKPVALSMEKAGVVVSVGYILRYLEAARRVKEFLAGRRATLALAWYLGGLPSLSWFGEKAKSGGQILDQTSHLIDLLGYLMGEVASVSANFGYEAFKPRKDLDIADSGVMSLRFANGALGSVVNSCGLGFRGPTPGIRLMGEGFFIEFTYNSLRISTPEENREEGVDLGAGYEAESRAFLEAVLTGRREKILCPYAEGMRTLAVVLAANRSAEEGQSIGIADAFSGRRMQGN
jgi:predicted dehydrogenase